MNITLICDMYGLSANGTSNTYNTLAREMVKRGHNVTIVTPCEKDYIDEFGIKWISVPRRNFHSFNKYVSKNGVVLGKPDKEKLLEGIRDADIVHILMPFQMGRAVIPLCRELHIAYTAATHVQAENVTAHMGLKNVELANDSIYYRFYKVFYQYVDFAHAPSELIAEVFKEHNCTCQFRVITNGVREEFTYKPTEKPEEYKDKFVIANTGRYSKEKCQNDLISAVSKSKYNDKIKLIIAGQGPQEKHYRKLATKLNVDATFGYLDKQDFLDLLNYADLYVHPSEIELEGISCLEAMACGRPCVFSDSKKAAMRFYANPDSLYKYGNTDDLAQKIDYYYEHPDERKALGEWYLEHSDRFKLSNAMDEMEKLFKDAIEYYKEYYKATETA